MDWMTLALQAILVGVCAMLTFVARKALKNKEVREFVYDLVTAAEQIFGSGTGEKKRDYVSEQLDKRWNLSNEEKEVLIESAVGEMSGVWNKADEMDLYESISFEPEEEEQC